MPRGGRAELFLSEFLCMQNIRVSQAVVLGLFLADWSPLLRHREAPPWSAAKLAGLHRPRAGANLRGLAEIRIVRLPAAGKSKRDGGSVIRTISSRAGSWIAAKKIDRPNRSGYTRP
jgi:hypothetical protein